jgi:hypothetical protein
MALRPPTGASARPHQRVTIALPSAAAAAEVGDRAGGLVRLGDGGVGDATLVVHQVAGATLVASGSLPDPRHLRTGRSVVVSWTEVNDWASLTARIDEQTHDHVSVRGEWPPTRRQRREFRRFVMELPLWVTTGVLRPVTLKGRTRDLSGGGLAAMVPDHRCVEGDRVVVVMRSGRRDVLAAATVQWVRPSSALLAVRFDLIAPADQDHLIGLVAQAEARRGW